MEEIVKRYKTEEWRASGVRSEVEIVVNVAGHC